MIKFKVATILLLSFFLTSCGDAGNTGFRNDSESSDDGRNGGPVGPEAVYTHCHLYSGPSNLNFALGTTTYSLSTIHLNFTDYPEGLTDGDVEIIFQKAKASDYPAVEAMNFVVRNLSNGSIRGPYSKLNNSLLISSLGGAQLSQLEFIFSELPIEYKIFRLEMTEIASGNSVAVVDQLIPEFLANPNKFASSQPNVLHLMHPLWAIRDQPLDDEGFFNRLPRNHSYCN